VNSATGRRQRPRVAEVGRPSGREVTDARIVRTFAVIETLDQGGEQEIEVGVTLAMAVGRHVHRQPIDPHGEVGAVVEVEAAQEILVRLALTTVLGGDEAGRELKQLGRARYRTLRELIRQHDALTCGDGTSGEFVGPRAHDDFSQRIGWHACRAGGVRDCHAGQRKPVAGHCDEYRKTGHRTVPAAWTTTRFVASISKAD